MTTIERHRQVDRLDEEGLVEIDGEQYYRVTDVDQMAPFLMSVVSDGDRWMFVSSGGALAAGRGDAERSLFPYVTDDRLHAAAGMSGPVTRLRVVGADVLWRPFDPRPDAGTHRSISKAVNGDAVVFEEHHPDLGLTVSYRWGTADRYGFVRTTTVTNHGSAPVRLDVLDGLRDLLPSGIDPTLYSRLSNLSNAYKRNELVDDTVGLAVYSLEAPVSDSAEPAEVLRATVVWSNGFDGQVVLDPAAVAAFDRGIELAATPLVTGVPGAYLLRGEVEVPAGSSVAWHVVADVDQDHAAITALHGELLGGISGARLDEATRHTGERLAAIMALADSAQLTGDPVACAHHVSNVTYNVMRGGVPLGGYQVDTADFEAFVRQRNRAVADRNASWFAGLPPELERRELASRISDTSDVHLVRLGDEYVPFSFSRRHGDPSRPWNKFSIRVADDAGRPIVYFEGNWRDVFQNWEATCASFPEFLPGVVAMFVDASTADGHNPYRITRDGIDWEVPDPDDPWGNIGYWGDHQIVYLLRLLEATDRYLPGEIARRLAVRSCTYADVPYRISSYDEMLVDPKTTITFDDEAAARTAARVDALGSDGKMLVDADGQIVLVTLLEKLLVTTLAKLSNFVPGAGIWMNTQRPEWNDANNALVGYGTSMVTLFHLRRFLDHLDDLAEHLPGDVAVSTEVVAWLNDVIDAFTAAIDSDDPDRARRSLMDRLGRAASTYRSTIYRHGFSGETVSIGQSSVAALRDAAMPHLDATIAGSRRPDGLVHSYHLLRFSGPDRTAVLDLPEMLEGQVAALTPGLFTTGQQADLVEALFESRLHRADLGTFVLAAPQVPPSFLDKNLIPEQLVLANGLLVALLAARDRTVVVADAAGRHRFAPTLATEGDLVLALDRLAEDDRWSDLVRTHRAATLDAYEAVFGHRAYLGRSGSMYAYEGIGSVYWHMVTKLLLAVQEAASSAHAAGDDPADVGRLVDAYRRVRAGLGFRKSAAEFGAIPIDPYSHTPAHAGAQQPGMTGAVKEEILARPRELGLRVAQGSVAFDALFLDADELLGQAMGWSVLRVDGRRESISLTPGSLGFTFCQVPVVVTTVAGDPWIELDLDDGTTRRIAGSEIGPDASAAIFGRTGEVRCVRAAIAV